MSAASAADVRREASISMSCVIRSISQAIPLWIDLPTGGFPCVAVRTMVEILMGPDLTRLIQPVFFLQLSGKILLGEVLEILIGERVEFILETTG